MSLLEYLRSCLASTAAVEAAKKAYREDMRNYLWVAVIFLAGALVSVGLVYVGNTYVHTNGVLGSLVALGMTFFLVCILACTLLLLSHLCDYPEHGKLADMSRLHDDVLPKVAKRLLGEPQVLIKKSDSYELVPESSVRRLEHVVHSTCKDPLPVPNWLVTHLTDTAQNPPLGLEANDLRALRHAFGEPRNANLGEPVASIDF